MAEIASNERRDVDRRLEVRGIGKALARVDAGSNHRHEHSMRLTKGFAEHAFPERMNRIADGRLQIGAEVTDEAIHRHGAELGFRASAREIDVPEDRMARAELDDVLFE